MFAELERFATAHRPCGVLTSDVGKLTDAGYVVHLACSCGAEFERWVTPKKQGTNDGKIFMRSPIA
jgi:hypothetical protein